MSRAHLEASSRAAATWYPAGENRVVARMLGGIKIVLDTRDFSLTPHLVMDGFWESWITVWARGHAGAGDRLLNVGANCGYYALLFAKMGVQVVAVEPQPHLAEGIRISAALNGLGDRLTVEECVAGVEEREVAFQLHDYFAGSAYIDRREQVTTEKGWSATRVQERPAHELMPDATCAFIDAEGYEPLIWAGLQPLLEANQLRWVALEWAPSRYDDPAAFLASMKEYGRLSVVVDDGRERSVSDQQLLAGTEWDTLVVRRA